MLEETIAFLGKRQATGEGTKVTKLRKMDKNNRFSALNNHSEEEDSRTDALTCLKNTIKISKVPTGGQTARKIPNEEDSVNNNAHEVRNLKEKTSRGRKKKTRIRKVINLP